MLLFCFLSAHKKVEFQGSVFGGYSCQVQRNLHHTFAAGGDLGVRININDYVFIAPTVNAYYSTVGFNYSIVPLQLMLRVGAGARGFSGYGVVGSGLVMDSVLGGMTAGAGVEYRYKKVGFFAEALGSVILDTLGGVWTIRGVAGVSVFL